MRTTGLNVQQISQLHFHPGPVAVRSQDASLEEAGFGLTT